METRNLRHPPVLEARLAQRHAPHVAPLNRWIDELNVAGPHWTPYFDPADGGIQAQVLLLLESPGPQASHSRFVSLDNDSGTSENLRCLVHVAGLSRSRIAIWNTVPWQMSAGGVVTPSEADVRAAVPLTHQLLSLLPDLRAVVLVGRKAERGWRQVGRPDLPAFACPHPSPQNFVSRPDAAINALTKLVAAAQWAKTGVRSAPA